MGKNSKRVSDFLLLDVWVGILVYILVYIALKCVDMCGYVVDMGGYVWMRVDEGGNNLMECIMFVVFVVFVIEILQFCVSYVVCVIWWIRVAGVWMWDVGCGCGRGRGSTDDIQCLFVRSN